MKSTQSKHFYLFPFISENHYNITIQIYMLFEGRLLSQSIGSGRNALCNYSIFKISHYCRLLICSIRPVTETYNITI
ncbi:hypothetical protein GIB67_036550 [Kingdonia uniflora]|uniref:Uncharacterized protein n=1 Tax=Kingdonia uniflora TaxID=39325 RepID=A0A7J7NZT9_9MAGN|nr:hypothetical protein GIB67_036550 [Kingdonia uniflora]